MGHSTKKIANITEPATVSLAANSNFVQFENSETHQGSVIDIDLIVNNAPADIEKVQFTIKEIRQQIFHIFKGTRNESEVNSKTFFVNNDSTITANNIKACLTKNDFLGSNFEITIPPLSQNGKLVNGNIIRIVAKGSGASFTFKLEVPSGSTFIEMERDPENSTSLDSILGNSDSCEIQLDVYENTGVFPGEKNYTTPGTYITTLSKSYFGKPLWFDVNTIWADRHKYSDSFLYATKWCDAGTVTDFRFIAKRFDGINNETFFYSDVLYALTGYSRGLETADLSEYVYDMGANNMVKPLTKQPVLTHIEGQRHYFNFILSDAGHNNGDNDDKLGILFKIYTQAGSYLGKKEAYLQSRSEFGIVNTICLDLDTHIVGFANAGRIKICLSRNGKEASRPLSYKILPACLYKVNDFAFLNSLGGWNTFNFGGTEQTDFKSETTTIYKTHTPGYSISSSIETVFNKAVTEQFIAQTMPVTAEVCEWLKEIGSSVAVYELSTKRYIVVDELSVKHNTKDDLFTLQMKYHYSDSYNAKMK